MKSYQEHSDVPFTVADKRKRGYFTVDNLFIDEYGKLLKPFGIAVYVCIARFANGDSEAWPSHETIARRCGMSKRQVGREIVKLADLGLMLVSPQYNPETKEHSSNLYTLLEVDPIVSQSIPPVDSVTIPVDSVTRRSKPIKKVTPPNSKKDSSSKKNYRPAEYDDIILG
jgi:hypothetical protein